MERGKKFDQKKQVESGGTEIETAEKKGKLWQWMRDFRDKIFPITDSPETVECLSLSDSLNACANGTDELISAAIHGERTDWFGEKHGVSDFAVEKTEEKMSSQQIQILNALGQMGSGQLPWIPPE